MKIKVRIGASAVAVCLVIGAVTPVAWASDGSPVDILRQGLLGAGVGAISAQASGGKAGKGALIGAGTSVIGEALMNLLFAPSPSAGASTPVYSYTPSLAPVYNYSGAPAVSSGPAGSVRHVIRKYDKEGNVVLTEEFWI